MPPLPPHRPPSSLSLIFLSFYRVSFLVSLSSYLLVFPPGSALSSSTPSQNTLPLSPPHLPHPPPPFHTTTSVLFPPRRPSSIMGSQPAAAAPPTRLAIHLVVFSLSGLLVRFLL